MTYAVPVMNIVAFGALDLLKLEAVNLWLFWAELDCPFLIR